MKKIRISQLKINTDAEDSANGNKNMVSNSILANNQANINAVKNNKLMTAALNMGSLSPVQKNYIVLHSTKTNKITEFSRKQSNNINGNNENRQSFADFKNDSKNNNSVYDKFLGGMSPKISNGIASKNRFASPVMTKIEKINNNDMGANPNAYASASSTLMNNLVSNNSASLKNRKQPTNLISMVKEGRNGGANSATSTPSNNKKNLYHSNEEFKEKIYDSNVNKTNDGSFTKSSKNLAPKPDPIPEEIKKLSIDNHFLNTYGQEAISVTTLMNNQNIPLELSNLSLIFPQYELTKCSTRAIGNISAYAVNTYQGIIRNYNEDRVSIILNIAKPQGFFGTWPKCSFFGIYDGHGGCSCSDFLRDQLHSYVVKDSQFPDNPTQALMNGFEQAEKDFIMNHALNKNKEIVDRSGSCAIVALIVEDICYVANVGDSRAVLSLNGGKAMEVLSNDHKPNEEGESKRIKENGGKVYQTQTPAKFLNIPNFNGNGQNNNQILLGPFRVFPGRLSVSRTFGDVEAKIQKLGGLPGVVIATPEIKSFKISEEKDFLALGCDGIFDQINNQEILDCVWMTMDDTTKTKNINAQCALGSDMIMKSSLVRRTLDNVTVAILAFSNFEKVFRESFIKKTETLSQKSSLYLCNVIENKDVNVHDVGSNYYSSTEPSLVVNKNIEYSSILSKNSTVSRKFSNDKDLKQKSKYMSPKMKDKVNLPPKFGGKTNNWPVAGNINYMTSNKDTTKSSLNRSNKVLSFEINKKNVISPKNRTGKHNYLNSIDIRNQVHSPIVRDRLYDTEKPISLKEKRNNFT